MALVGISRRIIFFLFTKNPYFDLSASLESIRVLSGMFDCEVTSLFLTCPLKRIFCGFMLVTFCLGCFM